MSMGVGMMGMMMGPWGGFSFFAFPFFGFFFTVFAWLAIIFAVGMVVRQLFSPPKPKRVRERRHSALDILKERYVRGEIDIQEFEKELKKLEPKDLDSSS